MSLTAKFNIELQQGATFRQILTWKDGSRRPVNLAGCTAKLQIREAFGSPALLTLTETNGLTLGDVKGTVAIFISDEQTAAMNFTRGVYDLLITFTNGDTRRLIEGRVTFSKAVTI